MMNAVALTAFEMVAATAVIIGLINEEKVALWEHRMIRKMRRILRRRKHARVCLVSRRTVAEKYCA